MAAAAGKAISDRTIESEIVCKRVFQVGYGPIWTECRPPWRWAAGLLDDMPITQHLGGIDTPGNALPGRSLAGARVYIRH